MAMALDRYFAICYPLRHSSILSMPVVTALGSLVLLRGVLLVAPACFLLHRKDFCQHRVISHSYCEHMAVVKLVCEDTRVNAAYGIFVALALTVFDITVIVVSYTMILRALLRLSSSESQHKAFNTCVSHVCTATRCCSPSCREAGETPLRRCCLLAEDREKAKKAGKDTLKSCGLSWVEEEKQCDRDKLQKRIFSVSFEVREERKVRRKSISKKSSLSLPEGEKGKEKNCQRNKPEMCAVSLSFIEGEEKKKCHKDKSKKSSLFLPEEEKGEEKKCQRNQLEKMKFSVSFGEREGKSRASTGKAHAAQVRRCTRSRQVEQRYAEAVNALRKAISLRSDALLNYRLFSSYIQLHAQQRCSLHRLAPQLPQLLLVGGPNVGKSSLFAALAAANQYVRERSRLQLRQLTAQAEAAAGATRVTAAATTKGAAANLPAGRTGGEFTSETAACTQRAPAAVSSTRKAAVDANAGRKTEKDGEEDSGGGRGWELADTWRLERRAMAVGRAFAFRAAAAAAEDEDAVATAAEAIAALPLDSAGDSATRAAEAAAATAIVAPYEFSTQGLVVAKVVERRKREMSSSDTLANLQTATLPTYRSVGQVLVLLPVSRYTVKYATLCAYVYLYLSLATVSSLSAHICVPGVSAVRVGRRKLIDGPPLLLRKEGEHGRNVFEKISLTVLSHLPCGVLFLFDASRLPRRQLSEQQLQLLKQQPTSESLQQGLLAFEDQEQEDEKERREGDECDISAGAAAPTSQSLVTYPVADNPHRGDHSGVTGEEPVSCFEFSPSSNNNRRGYTAEGVSGSTTRGETRGQGMVKKKKNKGSCPLHLLQQLELRNQLRQRFPKRPWCVRPPKLVVHLLLSCQTFVSVRRPHALNTYVSVRLPRRVH
ncbi:UNVERIFIED_CONTAM: hypothetical protein H355_002050 [Colinus virginianus]|nr:hypothetical protein H355_002050 [Colinus virginianus]